jgi:topoisomerase IV subunit A
VRAGKAFMTLDENEEPLAPVLLAAGLDHVAALSGKGKLLVFELAEMKEMPRGRGVIIIGLDHDEKLLSLALCTRDRVVVHGRNRAGTEVMAQLTGEDLAKHLLHRARKGASIARRMRPEYLETQTGC